MKQTEIRIAEQVSRALDERTPVVALESTVIAHGLPHPFNLETALACEEAARLNGATPATIGIVEGVPTIGLSGDQTETFAAGQAPDGQPIEKVGLNNLAALIAKGKWGATTVASSLKLAHAAGIQVLSTGGIGGVHRGASGSFDISADLTALGDTPAICVCAGAKAILDLEKTVERLETLGVPIVGYGANEFPAFYSRRSGLGVDITVETPDEAAEVAIHHWRAVCQTAVLVCAPVPDEFEIPLEQIDRAVTEAVRRAEHRGIHGKTLTPFLLAQMQKLTSSDILRSNRALLVNNAQIAAQIAASVNRLA